MQFIQNDHQNEISFGKIAAQEKSSLVRFTISFARIVSVVSRQLADGRRTLDPEHGVVPLPRPPLPFGEAQS